MEYPSQLSRRELFSLSIAAALPMTLTSTNDGLAQFPRLAAYCKSLRTVKGGVFQIGSDTHADIERPRHAVTLSPFRLGATPITVGIWKEYCKAVSMEMPAAPAWGWLDDHPMVNISYIDITTAVLPSGKPGFLTWAVMTSGVQLMLPTEAQWEAAAQSKRVSDTYPWGPTFEIDKIWCSKDTWKDAGQTASVTRKARIHSNVYGISDLIGNVWEWCQDWNGPYGADAVKDPIGPPMGTRRALRGGSWYNEWPDVFRTSYRYRMLPDKREDNIGFRLAAVK
jgi:formylglycine-generating enzyme